MGAGAGAAQGAGGAPVGGTGEEEKGVKGGRRMRGADVSAAASAAVASGIGAGWRGETWGAGGGGFSAHAFVCLFLEVHFFCQLT